MLIPVILSGGAGTRLWPVSREAHPKPFMRIGGGKSLLAQTCERAELVAGSDRTALIVTNREYYLRTRDELAHQALQPHYLLEPAGRNTGPAIALAALWALKQDADACMLVMPADHLITHAEAFREAAKYAEMLARDGFLVLFGIRPTSPETGYGYIEMGEAVSRQGHLVKRFVEKPDAQAAGSFLAQGNYVWNSGIFCFKASTILDAMVVHCPALLEGAREAMENASAGGDKTELGESFARLENISIDYAVMEKAGNIAVVPGDFGWSDMGAWSAVADALPADEHGNKASNCQPIIVDSRNVYVDSKDRLVAVIGLENVCVIDTPDALLVADRSKSQEVRQVVNQLKASGHEAHKIHRTAVRPWGTYTVLGEGPGFKIKRVVVKPKQSLSLQMHHHRSEHWVVVSGTANITVGESTVMMSQNESTYIPIGARHRLENPGIVDLVLIEVQCGSYLGEDDIVRFSDSYGRA